MREFVDEVIRAITIVATATVIVYLIGAAFVGWDWWTPGPDANRQVAATTYMYDSGLRPNRVYRIVDFESTTASADTPQCFYRGRDLFSSGITDNQSGPSWRITIDVGTRWTGPRLVTVIVSKSRVPASFGDVENGWVSFNHERLPLYYDHTWDSLYDQHVDGRKGAVIECMDGLSLGRMMNIGLKEVRWLTHQP